MLWVFILIKSVRQLSNDRKRTVPLNRKRSPGPCRPASDLILMKSFKASKAARDFGLRQGVEMKA